MADIELLFGVKGGDSITGDKSSGKQILSALTGILNKINAKPLEIKFKADKKSLEDMKKEIKAITSSFVNTSGESVFGDLSNIKDPIEKVVSIFEGDFSGAIKNVGESIGGITESLKSLTEEAKTISTVLLRLPIGLSRNFNDVIENFEELKGSLEAIYDVVDRLNEKEFSINNFIDNSELLKSLADERLELEKQRAIELLEALESVERELDLISSTNQNAFGRILINSGMFARYSAELNRGQTTLDMKEEAVGARNLAVVNRLLVRVQERMQILDAMREAANRGRNEEDQIPEIDTSRAEATARRIESVRSRIEDANNAFIDATRAMGSGEAGDSFEMASAEQYEILRKIPDVIKEIDGLFVGLRGVIESTFDFSTIEFDLTNVKNAVKQIQEMFDGVSFHNLGNGLTPESSGGGSGNGSGGGGSGKKNGGGSDEGDGGNKYSYQDVYNEYRRIHKLLNDNSIFEGNEIYNSLKRQVDAFESYLPSSLREAFSKTGLSQGGWADFLENNGIASLTANELMDMFSSSRESAAEFSAELEKAGQAGVSLKKLGATISSVQSALQKSKGFEALPEYEEVERLLTPLQEIYNVSSKFSGSLPNFASLGGLFEAEGLNASAAIEEITLAVQRLGMATRDAENQVVKSDITEAYKSATDLLNKNTAAKGSAAYDALSDAVRSFKTEMDAANLSAMNAGDTVSSITTDKVEELIQLTENLKSELGAIVVGGKEKVVTKGEAESLYSTAQNLLRNNTSAKGSDEYKRLEAETNAFKKALDDASVSGERLDTVIESISADSLEKLKTLISELKAALSQSGLGGKEKVITKPGFEDISTLISNGQSLLAKNTNASSLSSYEDLKQKISELSTVFSIALEDAKRNGEEFNADSIEDEINALKSALDTFSRDIIIEGKSGSTKIPDVNEIREIVANARKTLRVNDNASDTEAYVELNTAISDFEAEYEKLLSALSDAEAEVQGLLSKGVSESDSAFVDAQSKARSARQALNDYAVQVGVVTDAYKKFNAEVKRTGNGGSGRNADIAEYTRKANDVLSEYKDAGNLLSAQNLQGILDKRQGAVDALEKAEEKLGGISDTTSQEFSEATKEVEKLKEALLQIDLSFVKDIKEAISVFKSEASSAAAKNKKEKNPTTSDVDSYIDKAEKLLDDNENNDVTSKYSSYKNLASVLEDVRIKYEEAKKSAEESNAVFDGSTLKEDFDELRDAISTFEEDALSTDDILKYSEALRKLSERASSDASKWTAAKNGDTEKDYTDLSEIPSEINGILAELSTMSKTDIESKLQELNKKLKDAEGNIKDAGKATLSWEDKFSGVTKKFAELFSATKILSKATEYLKKMVSSVIELDSAMTELKKVTDETDAAYNSFLTRASERAKELGATLSDTITATADFARLGYSIEEAETLSTAAIVYKNVGDGISSISEASESIISTMQAFGVEVEDVMSIVDRFNAIGNNYAISSQGVGEVLLRSASAMKSAGNTIDETIALAAAANTIIQNPDSVGTMLKTISMYLRAAKTEAEDAGESTTGMASSVSELRQEILALTGNKVDIQIDNDTFKSTYQILKELSEVYGSLSDVSKANLLELIAGKRNANTVSALLENFDIATKALGTSLESDGSALAENEKYLDSISGKLAILKANFEALSSSVVDSDIIKLAVDGLSSLVGRTNSLVTALNNMGLSASVVVGIIGLLCAKVPTMTAAYKALTSAIGSLGGGFSDMMWLASNHIGVTTAVISAMALVSSLANRYFEQLEKARQTIKDEGKEVSSLNKEIVELSSSYLDLRDSTDDTEESKKNLLETENKLLESLGIERYELQKNIDKYGDYKAAIEQVTLSKINENYQKARNATSEYEKDVLKLDKSKVSGEASVSAYYNKTDLESSNAAIEALIDRGYNISTAGSYENTGGYTRFDVTLDGDTDTIEGILENYHQLGDMLDIVGGINGVTDGDNFVYKALKSRYDEMESVISDYLDQVDEQNRSLAQYVIQKSLLEDSTPSTLEAFTAFRDGIISDIEASGDFDDIVGDIDDFVDDILREQFSNFYSTDMSYDEDLFDTQLNNYLSKISEFKRALYEQDKNGFISSETYRDIFSGVDELKELISYENGKFTLDEDALDDYIDKLEESTVKTLASSGATDEQISRIYGLSSSLRELTKEEQDSIEEITALQEILNNSKSGKLYGSSEILTEMDEYLEKYPELISYIKKTPEGYEVEEAGLRSLIEARKENIKLTADEISGISKERQELIAKNSLEARQKLVSALGNGLFADAADEVFRQHENEISSIEDFAKFLNEYFGDSPDSDFSDAAKEYMSALILSKEITDTYLSVIKEFGTDDYISDTSSSSGSSSSSETEFEKQYKLHKHYLAMEQETDQEYFDWLEGAVASAKASGILSATDAYDYEEELYEKRKELFSDELEYAEHRISILENLESDASEIAAIYEELLESVEKQIDAYTARGLAKNSDYIQELESQWWEYRNSLLELYSDDLSGRISDKEHGISLIEYNDKNGERTGEILSIYQDIQSEVHATAEKYRSMGLDENSDYIQDLQKQWWEYQDKIDDLREGELDNRISVGKYLIDGMVESHSDIGSIVDIWKGLLSAVDDEIEYYTSKGYSDTSELIRGLKEKADELRDGMIEDIEDVVSAANELVGGFENVYSVLTSAAKEYAQTGYLSVDSLQSILELNPKYLSLLEDESGNLTINEEKLQKIIALRTEEMACETALSYAKQILLATEEKDIEKLTSLCSISEKAGNATWDVAYATLGLAKAMGVANGIDSSYYDTAYDSLKAMQALSKTATDSISAYYKTLDDSYISQKDALEKILDLVEEMIKHEIEEEKEVLEDQKESYGDIIDQKKELISLAEEQEDREKSISEKLEKMAKLQGQIARLSLDDSREAQAQRRSLEEELAELQKDLADDQSDYAYDKQVDALDKELEAFEKEKDDEIEALEDSISSTEKLYRLAMERISDYWENGWNDLFDELKAWNYEYGSTLESELVSAWDSATAAAQRYGSIIAAFEGVDEYTNLGSSISDDDARGSYISGSNSYSSGSDSREARSIINSMKEASLNWWVQSDPERKDTEKNQLFLAEKYEKLTGDDIYKSNGRWYREDGDELYSLSDNEIISRIVSQMKENASLWHTSGLDDKGDLSEKNQELAYRLKKNFGMDLKRDSDGVWWLGDKRLFDIYHTGGIVGGESSLKENEVMAILEKGEAVLDEKKEDGLFRLIDFISELSERIGSTLDISKIGTVFGTSLRGGKLYSYSDSIRGDSDKAYERIGDSSTGCTIEKIEVTAPVQVVQKLSRDELKEHADTIGSLSAKYIEESFSKRGIKKSASLL